MQFVKSVLSPVIITFQVGLQVGKKAADFLQDLAPLHLRRIKEKSMCYRYIYSSRSTSGEKRQPIFFMQDLPSPITLEKDKRKVYVIYIYIYNLIIFAL
jgi:hypothetical protein